MSSLSLDRITVERRRIAPRAGLTFRLPVPPATNDLFVVTSENGRVASGAYQAWKAAAREELSRQPRRYFAGPVSIHITFADQGRQAIENRARPILDLLAAHRFIAEGSRTTIRSLKLQWGDVQGCEVHVAPVEASR